MGLVGLVLQAYANLRDKGKPKWLKGLSLIVLGATAALIISIFIISVQFPPIALALNFAAIAVGVAMQMVEFMHSLVSLIVAKYKLNFSSKKDDGDKIADLKVRRIILFKQQTSIISALNHAVDAEKIAALQCRC